MFHARARLSNDHMNRREMLKFKRFRLEEVTVNPYNYGSEHRIRILSAL